MIFGIPARRLLVYAALIAALLGGNYWRLQTPDSIVGPDPGGTATGGIAELAEIVATAEGAGFTRPMQRDLFAVRPIAAPQPPRPQPAPAPQAPDPAEIARQAVRKTLDSIVVLGILGSDSGPLAVLEVDGKVTSVTQGQEVLPGYRVKSVSLDHLELVHAETGLEKLYLMGTSEN